MRKIVLTFGLIAGGLLSLMMIITLPFSEQIGFDRAVTVGYTTMVLAFLMVYFGVRAYRDNVANGVVSFGRAFKVGALITLIASTCYVATWQVMYYQFMPDHLDKYTAYTIDKAKASGKSEAEIASEIAETQKMRGMMKNPFVHGAFTFLEPLPVGLLFTLVSAGVLSRRRRAA